MTFETLRNQGKKTFKNPKQKTKQNIEKFKNITRKCRKMKQTKQNKTRQNLF